MERTDLELIKKHKDDDPHLAKLWEEHLELDKEIERLEQMALNSLELANLKKKKLQGRDAIEAVLQKYRSA